MTLCTDGWDSDDLSRHWYGRRTKSLAAGFFLALLLGGCVDSLPSPRTDSTPGRPVVSQARNGPFVLALAVADAARAGTPIDVTATLTFEGPRAQVVYSPGFGPIRFSLVQIGGPISIPAGGPADCRSTTMRPGETYSTPFLKAGGYEPGDPNASFYRAFFAEKDLVLPAGDWLIGAVAAVSLENCGGADAQATTTIRLRVMP